VGEGLQGGTLYSRLQELFCDALVVVFIYFLLFKLGGK